MPNDAFGLFGGLRFELRAPGSGEICFAQGLWGKLLLNAIRKKSEFQKLGAFLWLNFVFESSALQKRCNLKLDLCDLCVSCKTHMQLKSAIAIFLKHVSFKIATSSTQRWHSPKTDPDYPSGLACQRTTPRIKNFDF